MRARLPGPGAAAHFRTRSSRPGGGVAARRFHPRGRAAYCGRRHPCGSKWYRCRGPGVGIEHFDQLVVERAAAEIARLRGPAAPTRSHPHCGQDIPVLQQDIQLEVKCSDLLRRGAHEAPHDWTPEPVFGPQLAAGVAKGIADIVRAKRIVEAAAGRRLAQERAYAKVERESLFQRRLAHGQHRALQRDRHSMGAVVYHGERDGLVPLPPGAQLAFAASLERLLELGPEARNEQLPLAAHPVGHFAFKRSRLRHRRTGIRILRCRRLQLRERRPDRGGEPLVRQRQTFAQHPIGFGRIHLARAVDVDDELLPRGSVGGGISVHSIFRMHRAPVLSTIA